MSPLSETSRKTLPKSIAVLLSSVAPTVCATTFVTNCKDAGSGSLRDAVANAPEGDTVDASGLDGVCSTITLKTGEILVARNNLTIKGPGRSKLAVTAKYANGTTLHQYHSRIFDHTGTGTLSLQYLAMTMGYLSTTNGTVRGGCVTSASNLTLSNVGVYGCTAKTTGNGHARGGGIYVAGSFLMTYSVVKGNVVDAGPAAGTASGGGLFLKGPCSIEYSTISGNGATASNGNTNADIGGASLLGTSSYLGQSTVSGNTATSQIGGLSIDNTASGSSAYIIKSTISGNKSNNSRIGGVAINVPSVQILQSTIAFNQAANANSTTGGVGLTLFGTAAAPVATLVGDMIANNTSGGANNDLAAAANVMIGGNHNLVRTSSTSLPGDTITGACPLLGNLRNNGGYTFTHALLSHSPGIDVGSSNVVAGNDERGPGYLRTSGSFADIGAYEVQQNDIVFGADFEGCP